MREDEPDGAFSAQSSAGRDASRRFFTVRKFFLHELHEPHEPHDSQLYSM